MRMFYLLLLLCFTTSCNSDPGKKQFEMFAKINPKGSVLKSIMCKADMQQSYALYLPSGYSPTKKYPVIYCFDPHGDGSLPVNLLKEEAEKLGIVLIGSNNVQNGLSQDAVTAMTTTMMLDAQANINMDERRIYLAGFSGGARVALSALFQYSTIRGVIACSGSIPASYIPKQIYIAGIAGTGDMNYAEMVEMEKSFSQDADRHILFTFPGVHSWPPKVTINSALQWLSIGEMKDKIVSADKEIIEQFIYSQYNDSLSLLEKYRGCRQILRTLNGLTDISLYQQKLVSLEADQKLQLEMANEARLDSIEKAQQKIYSEAFNDKSIEWWRAEITHLRETSKNKEKKAEVALNKRLLAYISLYSFSASNYAKKAGDLKVFPKYLEIYGKADPENPDYFYFLAYYNALTGKKDECMKALEKAIHFGYTDKQKILSDGVFANLIDRDKLGEIVNKK